MVLDYRVPIIQAVSGPDANGIVYTPTNATFPAGTYPSGNWAANVQIVPTATPVSGPTLTVNLRISGGASYFSGSPASAAATILNTGPQLLLLIPASFGTNMSRNVTNDYAQFVVTPAGAISNGPGNGPSSVNPSEVLHSDEFHLLRVRQYILSITPHKHSPYQFHCKPVRRI